ncbi:MAG: TIGR04283 family arsenosugar biosynthesis glycosyltransferase [Caldimonas sp.]
MRGGAAEGHGLVVVVPVLDEAEGLRARLLALQPLRDGGARVVVVDGGSRDASVAIAEAHADLVLTSPRGRATQMNAGAAALECRSLLFLHADTALPEGADRLVCAALASGHRWGRFDVRLDSARPAYRVIERLINLRSRLSGIATGDQAIFVDAAAFHAVGGYPDLALMEDIALSKRLKQLGRPACLHAVVVTSARRWQRFGVWRTVWLMWRLRAAFALGADPARLARSYRVGADG